MNPYYCTEADIVFNNERIWEISLEEINVFIAITYKRRAHSCNGVHFLLKIYTIRPLRGLVPFKLIENQQKY